MARRVSVPAPDELFRRTDDAAPADPGKVSKRAVHAVPDEPGEAEPAPRTRPSGRVKHDEKMTVYVTADELLEIEHARLALRSRHGLAIDRGRLVREAIHLVLADLEHSGEDSALVRRLAEG